MEDLYRLFQLPSYRCYHRREDFHNARWIVSRLEQHGADQKSHATDRCTIDNNPNHGRRTDTGSVTRFLTVAYSVIYCGPIQIRTSPAGARTIVEYRLLLDQMLFHGSYKSTTWISSVVPIKL